MHITRRRFGFWAAGSALSASLPKQRSYAEDLTLERADFVPTTVDEEYLFDLYLDNMEPAAPDKLHARKLADWPMWRALPEPRERTVSVDDADNVDVAHLGVPKSEDVFEFGAADFERLTRWNRFERIGSGRIVFGLRGTRLVEPFPQDRVVFAERLMLQESSPNHFKTHCVLGVWDRGERKLWASTGSTVPNLEYMYGQREAKLQERICNLLLTGVYDYKVGTHRDQSKNRQPGAFRLTSKTCHLRIIQSGPLRFDRQAYWDLEGGETGDNIHAGGDGFPEDLPSFSSAGCQVIRGEYGQTRRVPLGTWAVFRQAAGLRPIPELAEVLEPGATHPRVRSTEDGLKYKYILLTGRDARSAATLPSSQDRHQVRLRRGSFGNEVKRLQEKIGLVADGDFGFETQRRAIEKLKTDGILTPAVALELGIALG